MPTTGRKLEHLERTAREHPEYRDVLSLFQALFAFVSGREEQIGISFDVADADGAARLAGGNSILSPRDLRVEAGPAAAWLKGVVGVLRGAGRDAGGELTALERALDDRSADVGSLLSACFARDREALERAARELSVQPALLVFVLDVPLKTALERFAETVGGPELDAWSKPQCPVCGGAAGMEEIAGEEGRRFLSCSGCYFKWVFRRIACPYCGNDDPESLSYFTADDGPTRVGVCRKCSRYIKTRDSRRGNADVPLEAEDITTLHLDLLAAREGYGRGT